MMSSLATAPAAPLLVFTGDSSSARLTLVGTRAMPQPMLLPTA